MWELRREGTRVFFICAGLPHEGHQQKHRCRMRRRILPVSSQYLKFIIPAIGNQPSTPGGPLCHKVRTTLILPDPQIEESPEVNVQYQKQGLKQMPQLL